MLTEHDERALDHQKSKYGTYIVKIKDEVGMQDEVKKSRPCLST